MPLDFFQPTQFAGADKSNNGLRSTYSKQWHGTLNHRMYSLAQSLRVAANRLAEFRRGGAHVLQPDFQIGERVFGVFFVFDRKDVFVFQRLQ